MPDYFDPTVTSKVEVPNLLGTLSTVAGTQNAINQNKLFQQTFQARQAVGQAYQQAIDPQTGELDTNKLTSLIANDPRASFMAGEVSQQALERQQKQLEVQNQQLQLAMAHYNNMANQFSTLAAKPNLTYQDFVDLGLGMKQQGLTTTPQLVQALTSIDPNATSDQLRQVANGWALKSLDSAKRAEMIYGAPQMINAGNRIIPTAVSPMTGVQRIGGDIGLGMSPETATAPTTYYDPATHQQRTVTRSQFVGMANGAAPGGGGAGGPSPAAPTAPSAVPAPVAPAGGPGVAAAPPLGADAAANVTSTASAQQGVNLQQMADSVPQRKALLGNLESELNNFTSGPGADWTKVGKAFANRVSPFGDIFDPKSIASQEEFAKQATQLAQAQFQALGGTGTDAKLDSAMHTSPNEVLSKMGNKGIMDMLKGNEDAIAVKNQQWQQYLQQGGSPADYGQFSTYFNKQFDPRVFQWTYMSPAERKDSLKGMNENEQSTFRRIYNNAVANGWVPHPKAQNGQ